MISALKNSSSEIIHPAEPDRKVAHLFSGVNLDIRRVEHLSHDIPIFKLVIGPTKETPQVTLAVKCYVPLWIGCTHLPEATD